jgi:hypothetical protein
LEIEEQEKRFWKRVFNAIAFHPFKGSHSNCLSPKWFNMHGQFESGLSAGSSGLGSPDKGLVKKAGSAWGTHPNGLDKKRKFLA